MYFSAPQLRKVACAGRFQLGLQRYVPSRAPPTSVKRNQIRTPRVRFCTPWQAGPNRVGLAFSSPTPCAGGLPPFPAGGSAGHQLNLLDHNGRRQGGPGPHPG